MMMLYLVSIFDCADIFVHFQSDLLTVCTTLAA